MYYLLFALPLFAATSAANCKSEAINYKEKWGYSNSLVKTKFARGDARDETHVFLQCDEDWHHFQCVNGNLEAMDEKRKKCGCDPAGSIKDSAYIYAHVSGPPSRDNGKHEKYKNGTLVTRFCASGPVVAGPPNSTCVNGEWVPKLGRCPLMCDLDVLTGRRSFTAAMLDPPSSSGQKKQRHLGNAKAVCYVSKYPRTMKDPFPYKFTCNDGIWEPRINCIDY